MYTEIVQLCTSLYIYIFKKKKKDMEYVKWIKLKPKYALCFDHIVTVTHWSLYVHYKTVVNFFVKGCACVRARVGREGARKPSSSF